MKKTLCITMDYPPKKGGVSTFLFGLLSELDPKQVTVVTDTSGDARHAQHTITHVSFQASWMRPRWLFAFIRAWGIVRKQKIEYILAGESLPSGLIALLLKRILGIPYAVFTYGMDIPFAMNHPRHKRDLLDVLKGADKIITISEYTKSLIHTFDESLPEPVVINPCPQKLVKPQVENIQSLQMDLKLDGKTVLLTVARLMKRKGHERVFEALKMLHRDDFQYLVVGDGSYRAELQKKAKEYGVEHLVQFIGEVSDAELPIYYSLGDIFIMPNRKLESGDVEGFGIVFLEANAFRLPVIGGHNGGVSDAIVDGQTGILVDSENTEEIAEAIRKLADDTELRRRLGEQGRARVEKEFQYQFQVKKLEKILE